MTLEDALEENNLIKDLRLSFSRVSDFDRNGPKTLINRTKIEGEFLDFGSLVDDMLQPDFDINEDYCIFDGEKPTAMLGDLCEYIIDDLEEYEITDEVILKGINELGLWKTTKDSDKLLAKFTKEAHDYVMTMVSKEHKLLVTTRLVSEAEEMVALLKTHEYSRDFFKKDLIYQQSIEFRFGNFNFLSLLDYIDIDHENKTIQGIDLKTGSKSVEEFNSNFVKFRYYLQAKLYQIAIKEFIYQNKELSDYKILPFKFLYCGRYEKIPTFIEVSNKWEDAALLGFETKSGYKYKGLYDLVDDIEWHWRSDVYGMSRNMYDSNGTITINDEFINVI